ncbi:hypothetical protein JCM8547_005138 [Rhodosporidiobolus lusitaniae]
MNDPLAVKPTLPESVEAPTTLPSPPPSPKPIPAGTIELAPSAALSAFAGAKQDKGKSLEDTKMDRTRQRIREAAMLVVGFVAGWSDAASGPLLPYIQEHYHVTYTVVSMLFVGVMCGGMLAAALNHYLSTRIGLGKIVVLGACCQAFACAVLIPTFDVFWLPVLFVFSGFGTALQTAQANAWVASLPSSEVKLSLLHASYGLGAAVSPLAATAFVSAGIIFSRFYAVSVALAVVNICSLLYAFRFNFRYDTSDPVRPSSPVKPSSRSDGIEEIELSTPRPPSPALSSTSKAACTSDVEGGSVPTVELDTRLAAVEQGKVEKEKKGFRNSMFWQAIGNRTMPFMCLFIFQYVGSEVSMGGWIVTFLVDNRGGGPDSGYVASGYWLGIVVGRLVFVPVTAFIGERRATLVYTAAALGLEILIWFHKSFISNAIVASFVGLLMGPSFPIAISVLTKLLPRRIHNASIALMSCFGQVGSALFPFVIGALAQKYSPSVLPPTMVVLLGGQVLSWGCLPKVERKSE